MKPPPRQMKRPARPLFLERSLYRRRRVLDAVGFLPVLGVFMMILPAFWTVPGGGAVQTQLVGALSKAGSADAVQLAVPLGQRLLSSDVIWFFSAWTLLIIATAVLARALRHEADPSKEADLPRPLSSKPGEGHQVWISKGKRS